MGTLVLILLKAYQLFISPLLRQFAIFPAGCRFYPTCSEYGLEAIRQYGLITGFMFLLVRLSRCHPWTAGGHDPVPEVKTAKP